MRIPMNLRAKRRGAVAAEFAVISIVMLLLVFGVFEFGRFLFMRQLMENAAREGSRFACVHTQDKTLLEVQTQTKNTMFGFDGMLKNHSNFLIPIILAPDTTSDIRVFRADINGAPSNFNTLTNLEVPVGGGTANWFGAPWTNARFGDRIAVQIVASYRPATPALLYLPDPIPMQITAAASSEAN